MGKLQKNLTTKIYDIRTQKKAFEFFNLKKIEMGPTFNSYKKKLTNHIYEIPKFKLIKIILK